MDWLLAVKFFGLFVWLGGTCWLCCRVIDHAIAGRVWRAVVIALLTAASISIMLGVK